MGRECEGMGGGLGVGVDGGGRSAALVNDEPTRFSKGFVLAVSYSAETVVFSVNSGSRGVHY